MPQSKLNLFAQLLVGVDRSRYKNLVKEYQSDKHSKGISTWTHFVSMVFMQFAHLDSLRDLQNGLRSLSVSKNHLNIGKVPSKSSLSYLNAKRNADFFQDLYFDLLQQLEPSLKRQRQHKQKRCYVYLKPVRKMGSSHFWGSLSLLGGRQVYVGVCKLKHNGFVQNQLHFFAF